MVYMRTDREQRPFVVTAIKLSGSDGTSVSYCIEGSGIASWVYGYELSPRRDEVFVSTGILDKR